MAKPASLVILETRPDEFTPTTGGQGPEEIASQEKAHRPRKAPTLFSLRISISRRLVMIKARLILLLVICAVIMLTAIMTWMISVNATNESFDDMSAELRNDEMSTLLNEVKDFLTALSFGMTSLTTMLGGLAHDYTRKGLGGPVLTSLWATFSTFKEITTLHVVTADELVAGYRRGGPAAAMLGQPLVVAITSPENDTTSVIDVYVPDPETGAPLAEGPLVKLCRVSMCPDNATNATSPGRNVYPPAPLYLPSTVPDAQRALWASVGHLPKGVIRWSVVTGSELETSQPSFFMASALRDPTTNVTLAVLSITSTALRLIRLVQSASLVQLYGGRVFVTSDANYMIVAASNGSVVTPPEVPGGVPTRLSAMNSSDDMIRHAAWHLFSAYGSRVLSEPFTISPRLGSSGGTHYVHTAPLPYGEMTLVITLVVPRASFRGDIEESRRRGLLVAMMIVILLFLLGGVAMCLSTASVSRQLTTQEKGLDDAAAANVMLTRRLQRALTISKPVPQMPVVDMSTPLGKLTDLLKNLPAGVALTDDQIRQMQTLITADDLHKPQFLTAIHNSAVDRENRNRAGGGGNRSGGRNGSNAQPWDAQSTGVVDAETGVWLELFATGRRVSTSQLMDRGHRGGANHQNVLGNSGSAGPTRLIHHTSDISTIVADSLPLACRPGSDDGCDSGPVTMVVTGSPRAGGSNGQVSPVSGSGSPNGASDGSKLLKSLSMERGRHPKAIQLVDRRVGRVQVDVLEMLRDIAGVAAGSLPNSPTAGSRGADRNGDKHNAGGGGQDRGGEEGGDRRKGRRGHQTVGGVFKFMRHPGKKLRQQSVSGNSLFPIPMDRWMPATNAQHRQVELLRRIGKWDFDALALAEEAPAHVVQLVGFTLFRKMGLVDEFGISEQKLANFLQEVARGMLPNPYHNAAHIADVSGSLYHLLHATSVGEHVRAIDRLAAVVAALIHDYKHPGFNNDFLQRTREELATIYNDQSPLENYHLAETFQLLYSNEHCNFLEVLSDAEFTEVRRVVIQMVLASDIKRHFGILDAFKARVSQETPWDLEKDSDRLLLLQLALKVADIGHAAKPLAIHQEWSRRVNEEFYLQGDAERAAGLLVSPFMDRYHNNVPKSQVRPSCTYRYWNCCCHPPYI
eukprot:jgi/Mesvir1/25941/Mv20935-RA.1